MKLQWISTKRQSAPLICSSSPDRSKRTIIQKESFTSKTRNAIGNVVLKMFNCCLFQSMLVEFQSCFSGNSMDLITLMVLKQSVRENGKGGMMWGDKITTKNWPCQPLPFSHCWTISHMNIKRLVILSSFNFCPYFTKDSMMFQEGQSSQIVGPLPKKCMNFQITISNQLYKMVCLI